jgi:polyvinyl alcohol dehydrogenase (cytochrome)
MTNGRGSFIARSCALAVTLALAGPATAGASDWPSYGKDLANSRNGGTDGPSLAQVTTLTQAWKFDSSDGDFTGTPVVAAGTLVAGSGGGSIYALDSATGNLRWSRDVNEPINGTAVIVPDPRRPGSGVVYEPIPHVGSPHVLALSLRDGSVLWDTVTTNQATATSFGSPTVWNGTVYMGTSADNGDNSTARGSLVAIDAKSGHVKWRTFMVPPGDDGGPVWSTPAIDTRTGRIYVGTGNAYHAPAAPMTDSIVALDAKTGKVLGHFQATPDDVFSGSNPAGPDADFGASPNLLTAPDGRALVGEGQKSGIYWALDRATLKPVWHTTVGPSSAAGGIIGSTAFDATRIYGPNTLGGEVWSLDHAGNIGWLSSEVGPLAFSPVAVSNGVVYTADSGGFVTARDAATGVAHAELPLGAPSFGGVSIAGGAVYASVGTGSSNSGSIVAFGDTTR